MTQRDWLAVEVVADVVRFEGVVDMLNFQLKDDTVAFAGIEQFTKKQAVKWLAVEEQNALEIERDAHDRGLSREADAALIRAEACAIVQQRVRKNRKKLVWDLDAELGAVQAKIGGEYHIY